MRWEEIDSVCHLLAAGESNRGIERATGHHRDTVGKLLRDMLKHHEEVENRLAEKLQFSATKRILFWLTVHRNKKQ